jgi:hypothetical protein
MNTYRLKGTAGPAINQTFALDRQISIGSGEAFDVVLDKTASGENSDVTALVERLDDQGIRIRVTAGTGILTVNGDPVTEASLALGDEIRLGPHRFILQAPGLRPERVLTQQVARPRRSIWPWLAGASLILGGAAALAWQQGWVTPLLG